MEGQKRPARIIGRYAVYDAIAAGGMATVHFGRLLGPVGFSRTVAIKRLHPQYASDPEFVSMFLDEARLAARIRHPHVVPTLDVVATEGELFLVMDYVPGESLSRLLRAVHATHENIPPRIVIAIMSGVLQGLHAAHEAKNERGEPLGIVHRDVSPQNVLVGSDGQSRVLDFGVAKAAGRVQTTREGQLKGKISYMAPEQLGGLTLDRRCDVFSASVVLWEALTSERLFAADNEGAAVARVLEGRVEPPSQALARLGRLGPELEQALEQLDAIVLRGLAPDPQQRFQTAHEMAVALEDCIAPATTSHVAHWIQSIASSVLAERAAQVADIESSSIDFVAYPAGSVSPSSPSASSNPLLEVPTVALASSPSNPNPIPEPSSQLSSISAVNSTPPQRTSKRRVWVAVASLIAGAIVAAAIVAAFAIGKGRSQNASVSASAQLPAEPASPSVASSLPPPTSATAAETSEKDGSPPAPSASTHKRIARPPPAPKPACNPPYTWDSEGHKHYKPECL